MTGDFPVQPFRVVAAVKFLSHWDFSLLSYWVLYKPIHFQSLPCTCMGYTSMRFILSLSGTQSWCKLRLVTGALSCFFSYFAPNKKLRLVPINPLSQISQLLLPSCGFAAATRYLQLRVLPPPASSLRLLHPAVHPFLSPSPWAPWAGLGEQMRSLHIPCSGKDTFSSSAPLTPLIYRLFSKITSLNKQYYQQEHNQISERRSPGE